MDRMIADLLDVSQIESGHLTLDPVPLDVAVVLTEGVRMQQGRAADRGVTLSVDIATTLPSVHADPDRLLQVLSNLIGNAIKFTSPGGKISLHACESDGAVVITVADTGPGIPAEQLPHVFAPYWQQRRSGTPRGTGLGLAIVKGIIDAHNGRVWVESIEGEGSRFSFSLNSPQG
jgi:signal transduction histidine kinase